MVINLYNAFATTLLDIHNFRLQAAMFFRPISQAIQFNFNFTASSILGIFPFRVVKNELKLDKLFALYSLVLSCCITTLYSYSSWIGTQARRNKMIQDGITFNYFLILGCFLLQLIPYLSFPICFYFNRNAITETVDSLDALEPLFNKLDGKKNKRLLKIDFFKNLCPPLFCGIVLYFGNNTWGSIPIALGFTFGLVSTNLIRVQFIYFVDTVIEFIQACTVFLARTKRSVSFVNSTRLEKVVSAVSQLVSTSSNINKAYSIQFLLTIFTSYWSIMSFIYYFYINVNTNYGWGHPSIPGDLMIILYYFTVVWSVTNSAVQANNKSKEFNTLLYQLMIEDKTNQFINNDKLRLHISMKREVVFTACGFFNLDYTLVHSMIASATTYLVILIQFGQPMNNDTKPPHMVFTNLTTPLPIPFTTYL
ncbi:Gustatory receptor 46a [Halyomorpha halys]|nr:Gustatory receptor 46a [Halyomorpha halys]